MLPVVGMAIHGDTSEAEFHDNKSRPSLSMGDYATESPI